MRRLSSNRDQAIPSDSKIGTSESPFEDERQAIVNALCVRGGSLPQSKLTPRGREWMGLRLDEIARNRCERFGMSTRGLDGGATIDRALKGDGIFRSGGMASTSDFPHILLNVLNVSLRVGYDQPASGKGSGSVAAAASQ